MTANEAICWGNADVDWNDWPVQTYLGENYRQLHPCDDAVLVHHSAFYRRLPPASIARSLEIGAGPNVYPLFLASAASQSIDAIDPSAANVAYLTEQVSCGPDDSWQPFFDRCRSLNPRLAPTMDAALGRVRVTLGGLHDITPGSYDLASMSFVAESISEDENEVAEFCHAFVRSVRPGGHLVAAFMENQSRYRLGNGSQWPGCPVDGSRVREFFAPHVADLMISRIDSDPELPGSYGGYTGMILLTARRSSVDAAGS